VYILPWDHYEQIQKQPPGEQEYEIKGSHAQRAIILLNMRLDRHCRHHGNDVQKKNDIAHKGIRRLMPQIDLDIGPHHLRSQPHPQAKAHKRPEQAGLGGSRSYVGQKCDGSAKQDEVLHDVAYRGEREAAGRYKGQHHVGAHHRAHPDRPPSSGLERTIPHASILSSRGRCDLLPT
jgi:hypothetical protein